MSCQYHYHLPQCDFLRHNHVCLDELFELVLEQFLGSLGLKNFVDDQSGESQGFDLSLEFVVNKLKELRRFIAGYFRLFYSLHVRVRGRLTLHHCLQNFPKLF